MKKLLFIFAPVLLLFTIHLRAQSTTSTTTANTTAVAAAPPAPANSGGGLWGSLKKAAKAAKDSVIARKLANAQKKDSLHKNTFLGSVATTAATSIVKPGTPAGTTTPTSNTGTTPAGNTPTTAGSVLSSLLNPSQGNNAGITPAGNGNPGNSTDKIAFQIDACTGNSSAQTVTIFFTIANPNNVNQNVVIGLGPACKVIDPDGNLCHPRECRLGDADGSHWTELPTGIKMKGSITFSNILPKQAQLALLQFNIFSVNSDGGRDGSAKQISVRNLNVAWQ